MKLADISQLIEVRNYMVNAVNNFNLNSGEGRELQKMLILVDKCIVKKILSVEFKEIINSEFNKEDKDNEVIKQIKEEFNKKAEAALHMVVENNNIKKNMNVSKDMVVSTGNKTEILKG